MVKCLQRRRKGHFVQFTTPVALAGLVNCAVLVLILTPVRKREYVVRLEAVEAVDPRTAAITFVHRGIRAVASAVAQYSHTAVTALAVVRMILLAEAYLVGTSVARFELFFPKGLRGHSQGHSRLL
jgi:hypothetical protein